MIEKLSQRDKRALMIGVVGVAAILIIVLGAKCSDRWGQVRGSLARSKDEFRDMRLGRTKQKALMSVAGVFEMPKGEQEQKFLFREKFNKQLKKAGIKSKPIQVLAATKMRNEPGYKILRLKCSAEKCKFGQVLDLLAALNKNPYLAGIDEFSIKCSEKNRQEVQLNLTVSTFVKSKG